MTTSDADTLARRLVTDGYGATFVWPAHDATLSKIWNDAGNPALLERLVDDTAAPAKARLVAVECLFKFDYTFLGRHDGVVIAGVYAAALAGHVVPAANPWGLLWENQQAGLLGGRFIMLDQSSIPVLRPLLSDGTVVDWYEGSEEATVGNALRYRIKDFAAFYLARIINHPVAFHADFAERDREIRALVAALP